MFAGLISFKLYQFNWNGGLRILMCLEDIDVSQFVSISDGY
jgi:hypothetical protein